MRFFSSDDGTKDPDPIPEYGAAKDLPEEEKALEVEAEGIPSEGASLRNAINFLAGICLPIFVFLFLCVEKSLLLSLIWGEIVLLETLCVK